LYKGRVSITQCFLDKSGAYVTANVFELSFSSHTRVEILWRYDLPSLQLLQQVKYI